MKKMSLLLGVLLLTLSGGAQVTINEKGSYVNNDGNYFTGTLENTENGYKKSAFEIKDGQMNGEVLYYYASGKLMEKGNFVAGQKDGEWHRYNESGVTVGLAIYKEGKKNGTWMVWDDSGKKRFEMHYKMGEKTGVWYNWDENGELLSSKDFGTVN